MGSLENWLQPMERRSISTVLMDAITDQLLKGELKPGDKLPTETELVAKLGVSRNAVREATKMLFALGVVETKRGQGTFITKSPSLSTLNPIVLSLAMSQPSTHELAELRSLIDGGISDIACRQITDEEIERLSRLNDALRVATEASDSDVEEILELDLQFHTILIEATRNSLIEKLGKTIYTLYSYSMKQALEREPERAYHDHEKLVEALKKRDPLNVRAAVAATMEGWEELMNRPGSKTDE